MTAVSKKRLTPDEYLTIERKAETKSEYLNGEMFAMAGASYKHTLLKDNFAGELHSRLKGKPCRPLTSDIRVRVTPTGLYTYPDVVVLCGEPEFADKVLDTLLNPSVIVEILSESSEMYDRGAKFRHYRSLKSLKEYILISQDRAVIERFVRQPDDNWLLTTFANIAEEVEIATVGVRIPMAEIYRGVELVSDDSETTAESLGELGRPG